MSSIPNKASALGAIIILAMACAISVSAQTPAAVSGLTVTDSLRETRETAVEMKSVPPTKGTDLTTGPAAGSEVSPGSEVSAAVRADTDTKVAAGLADEGRGATREAASASPQTASSDDKWQFQFSPYLWIAGISGRAGIGNLEVDVDSGLTSSNVHLNFGFMSTFEARKGKLVFLTDLQYSNLGTERPTPGPLFSDATASFKTFILDPEVGYRFYDNDEGSSVDVLGGIRYWHLRADLDFGAGILPAASATRSRGWVDGVVGLRGKAQLSPRWFVTGKGDLGGGGSEFTYQLFGGVGVMVHKKVALIGGYRYLKVDYDKDDFLFDMALHGPILGFGFKF